MNGAPNPIATQKGAEVKARKNVAAVRRREEKKKQESEAKNVWSLEPIRLPYKGAHLTDEQISKAVEKLVA